MRSWPSFGTGPRGYLPGATELLGQFRPRHRLAALSNSNSLHWDRNGRDLNVPAWFDAVFSSHQLGHHKPAPGSYLGALAALGVSPEHVTFFDDAPANVEGARAVGIRSFQVAGVTELTACLRSIEALEK
jgi:glucose-1-phosphatase